MAHFSFWNFERFVKVIIGSVISTAFLLILRIFLNRNLNLYTKVAVNSIHIATAGAIVAQIIIAIKVIDVFDDFYYSFFFSF